MGIETKIIVEVSCDYPGCKEILTGGPFDFSTFKGWNYEVMISTIKISGWGVLEEDDGKKKILCKQHSSIETYVREYIP